MHISSILSLLSAFAFVAFSAGSARAEVCSERITSVFDEDATDHLVSTSYRQCTRFWQGTLPESNVSAEIMVETALGEMGNYTTEVVLGLKLADQALVKLGSDAQIGNHITVILASRHLPAAPSAGAYADLVEGDCYLVTLPRSHDLAGLPGALAFIMAHELFHCVQKATLTSSTRNKWWMEGSAHWFAHMAQPNQVVETFSQSANKFERDSGNNTLRHFEYPSWPFFAWYAQHSGNARAVMSLLDAMPEGTHSDADIAGLLSAGDWGEFAKQYSAYQIMVAPRVWVNPRPRATLRPTRIQLPNIGDERDYSFRRRTGALERYKIILKPGDWQFSTESSGTMYLSEIGDSGDPEPAWQGIGQTTGELSLSVPCGESTEYALVGFGSNPDDGDFVLTAHKVGDPCEITCDAPPSGHDACLIGMWEETSLAIPGYAKRTLQDALAEGRGRLTSLNTPFPVVTFFPDSSAVTVDITGSGTTEMRGQETKLEVTLARGDAFWGTTGDEETGFKLLICPQTMNLRGEITLSAGGRSHSIPISSTRNLSLDAPDGILFDYTCTASRVTLHNAEKDIDAVLER